MMIEFSAEQKEKFAKAWVLNENPFEAALSLFAENDMEGRVTALQMASFLPKDEIVLQLVKDLKAAGADLENLPSKGTFARELWRTAQTLYYDPAEKIKFMRLLGETLGYVSNKTVEVNNNNNTNALPPAPTYQIVNE